jgi:type II secretory pathway pseudopilin PulG
MYRTGRQQYIGLGFESGWPRVAASDRESCGRCGPVAERVFRPALCRRTAFTIVELLVVIGIISILMALMLPAVQMGREAARRTQCANNIGNLAKALLQHHEAYRNFPPAINVGKNESPIDGSVLYKNWVIDILPFLEQQPLYDSFTLFDPNDPKRLFSIAATQNRTARGTRLPVMLCPSDNSSNQDTPCGQNGGNWARGNYAANGALASPSDEDAWNKDTPNAAPGVNMRRGVMGVNKAISLDKIRDGTGETFLLLEIRVGLDPQDRRGAWAMGLCGSSSLWQHGSNGVNRPNSCAWGDDDLIECPQLIATVGRPALQRECMSCLQESGVSYAIQATARSNHRGGINVAMCSGSVRFISDQIESGNQPAGSFDPTPTNFLTWQRLIASQDGLPIDPSKWQD